jgi:hypothetical protein
MAEPGESENLDSHSPAAATVGFAPVFISYASHDAAVAQQVCAALEAAGFSCWIAPRDVRPGAQYADAIVGAINEAKATVLVLSQSAIASSHVAREVERTASKHKPIIAFRIDAATLSRALEYFLSNSQWIDVLALGMPAALAKLKEAVPQVSASTNAAESVIPAKTMAHQARGKTKHIVIAAMVVVGIGVALAVVMHFWPLRREDASVPAVAALSGKSIAVLPFADMSEKKDQEYFADGMAEEILDQLVKIPGLTVIGRTSSFQFKG